MESGESVRRRDLNFQLQLPQEGAGTHTATLSLAGCRGSIHGQRVGGALEPAGVT
jgi:hypothetical protein